MSEILKQSAEVQFQEELEILKSAERDTVPLSWQMSPSSVMTYIMGGWVKGREITPKYIGDPRLVEIAIASLLTERSLLLTGEPGTAKTWLSEHLAAAAIGDSTLIIQGSAGITEEQVKYGWNYALLLAEGPSQKALVKTPLFNAMERGKIVRFEELTRCSVEVSDVLISLLSEKCLTIPELSENLLARRGFSVIATSNTRDKGVHELSAALKRRFTIVNLPSPSTLEEEIKIVSLRVSDLCGRLGIENDSSEIIAKATVVFRELRQGKTLDGKQLCPTLQTSVAQVIGAVITPVSLNMSLNNNISDALSSALYSGIVLNGDRDLPVWKQYVEDVLSKREDRELYEACKRWPI